MNPKTRSFICFFLGVSMMMIIFAVGPTQHTAGKILTTGMGQASLNVINCSDKLLKTTVVQRGSFVIFQNFVVADKQFQCGESITLTSPGDYRFLDNVVPLVERWRGPISIALYAPGYDFYTTLESIAFLRTCTIPLVKKYVTFHLFFENAHMPTKKDQPLLNSYEDVYDCDEGPPYENRSDEAMYKAKHNLMYPINVARNVAKTTAQTYFVFPSDIELYPTRNFIQDFMDFVRRNPQHIKEDKKNVFVLPIFEILAEQEVPENKTQLQQMITRKKAFLFHKFVCSQCHKVINGDEWVKAEETQGLNVFSVGKRQGKNAVWEPFFVCTHKEPLWDERLNWEGQGNKMCQVLNLCILDYDFMVLDNAFLIHKPGVKKKKIQNSRYAEQTRKNNRILQTVQKELETMYGKNQNCKAH